MPRVLIVSPHFPPSNAPDHQRVRTSLPYMEAFGWNATIVAVHPKYTEALYDSILGRTVSKEVTVHRTSALSAALTRWVGVGSLALRALPFLWLAGNRLLRRSEFDLVYFSTTMFPVIILGPIWKRRFGVPYVVDFQDPWLTDYYDQPGAPSPPGGRLKHGLHNWIARSFEPQVMRYVAQTIVVSPGYSQMLQQRYGWLKADSLTVLPFGAPEKDFELLPSLNVRQRLFNKTDGLSHWVYVGRGGGDMAPALRVLFGAIAAERSCRPDAWTKICLHFAGTDYAPSGKGKRTVEPIAAEYGVADLVSETPDRLPYFESLQALVESDALLVIGSDSPAYSPSKLYPYVLAKRPMLAVLHAGSPGVTILRDCKAADVVTFRPGLTEPLLEQQMSGALQRLTESDGLSPQTDWEEFSKYSARAMTQRQCAVFDRAVSIT
ncbi:MAG: glycosyltransferase [Bryobacteraceae bacterium]